MQLARMQLAGPRDGGLAYTEWDLEVQNGNSGLSLRTDHAPAMEGEDAQKNPGYAMLGHIFAIGYTKGLMQALNIAYE